MPRYLQCGLLIALVFLSVGCAKNNTVTISLTEGERGSYPIPGTSVIPTRPLSGVTVKVDGVNYTTDNDGTFDYPLGSQEFKRVNVIVNVAGYKPCDREYDLINGRITTIPLFHIE